MYKTRYEQRVDVINALVSQGWQEKSAWEYAVHVLGYPA